MKKRISIISILIIIGLLGFLFLNLFDGYQKLFPTVTKILFPFQETITAKMTQNSFVNSTLYPGLTGTASVFALTPSPTLTPTITMTPRPTMMSPIHLPDISLSSLPIINYDLIWFSGDWDYKYSKGWGELRRLNNKNHEIEILVGNAKESIVQIDGEVVNYQYNSNQELIVFISREDYGEPEYFVYKINVLKLSNLYNETIYASKPIYKETGIPFEEVAISPNGNWITFIENEYLDKPNESGNREQTGTKLFLVSTEMNSTPLLWDECSITLYAPFYSSKCHSDLVWSPDNERLAFHGDEGLWIIDLAGNKDEIIQDFTHPSEIGSSIRYYPMSWSPMSNFLAVVEWHWESSINGVVNIKSKNYENLDITYLANGSARTTVSWLKDSQLIIVFNPNIFNEELAHPDIYFYQLNDKGYSLIANESKLELKGKFWERVIDDFLPEDGVFSFVTYQEYDPVLTDLNPPFGLLDHPIIRNYQIDFHKKNIIEDGHFYLYHPYSLEWTPFRNDISFSSSWEWAFLKQEDGENRFIYLLSFDRNEIYSITSLFNEKSCCFEWIEN